MQEVGFRTGDKIISIDGKKPEGFLLMVNELFYGKKVLIERGGRDTTLVLPQDLVGQIMDNRTRYERSNLLQPRIPFYVGRLPKNSINKNSGLKVKDRIVKLNGQEIKYFDQAVQILDSLRDTSILAIVERPVEGQDDILNTEEVGLTLQVSEKGKIEVELGGLSIDELDKLGIYDFETLEYGFFASIPAGFIKAKENITSYLRQFKLIFNFKTGAYKGVGGFIAIKNLFPPVWDWHRFWIITALLSIMLAVLNLLPIPALDGGHVMFTLYEMITGRKPGNKFIEIAQIVGMIIILFLILYANGNDIIREIFGK
jgi:regulator of sigma E protease